VLIMAKKASKPYAPAPLPEGVVSLAEARKVAPEREAPAFAVDHAAPVVPLRPIRPRYEPVLTPPAVLLALAAFDVLADASGRKGRRRPAKADLVQRLADLAREAQERGDREAASNLNAAMMLSLGGRGRF
jgi:hypothetical protein